MASCRRHRSRTWNAWSRESAARRCRVEAYRRLESDADHVRLDQGLSHHRGDRLDGGYALSAAAVRLSLRGRKGLGAVRDVQGDGAPAVTRHRQSGHGRDLRAWPVARLAWT